MRPRFHAPGLIVSLAASSSSLDRLSTGDLSEFAKCGLLILHRPTVRAPRFRIWINLGRLNKSAVDLKALASADANYLVGNSRLSAASPTLFIYCCVSLAGNLSVGESVAPKLFLQRLVGMAFLTPTLNPSSRFLGRDRYRPPKRQRNALCLCCAH